MAIDLIAEKKRILRNSKIDVIKMMCKDPSNYFFMGSELASWISSSQLYLDNPVVFAALKAMGIISVTGLTMNFLKNEKKMIDELNVEKRLLDMLYETETYKNLVSDYNEIVNDIVKLFSELKIKNPLDVCIVFSEMIENGLLSITAGYQHKSFFHDYDIDECMWGTRVFSGYGVCRHISSLLSDIFEKLGYSAFPMQAKIIEKNKVYSDNGIGLRADHLVVGVCDGTKKIIYDPTNLCFGYCDLNDEDGEYYMVPFNKNGDELFYFILKNQKLINGGFNRYLSSKRYIACENYYNEISELYKDDCIKKYVLRNFNLLLDFYSNDYELMKDIVKEEAIIAPHSDKAILKWTID